MSQWKTIKIGDFIALQRGHDLPERNRVSGTIPVYGSAGINGFHNVARAKGPGVVLGRSGASYGVAHYCPTDYWPHNTVLYVTDFKGNDERFVYYFLDKFDFSSLNSGSAQPSLNRNFVYLAEARIPPFPTQRRIAAILSAYDDLIENNLRRIKILEEMAQNIYREWFVEFRFPGHQKVKMVDSPLGKIPEGWEVSTLGSVCALIKEPYREELHASFPLIDLARIPQKTLLASEVGSPKELSTSRIIFSPDDVLFGAIRSYLYKVILAPTNGVTNVSVFVLRSREEIRKPFVAVLLSMEDTIRWADQYSTGTKMPVIKWDVFQRMKVLIPKGGVIHGFYDVVWPMMQLIKNTFVRNSNLCRTRDLLLPKLISGELDVSELDITIPEANA